MKKLKTKKQYRKAITYYIDVLIDIHARMDKPMKRKDKKYFKEFTKYRNYKHKSHLRAYLKLLKTFKKYLVVKYKVAAPNLLVVSDPESAFSCQCGALQGFQNIGVTCTICRTELAVISDAIYPIGTKITAIHGATSDTINQVDTFTGPNAGGIIADVVMNSNHTYSVIFSNGVSIFITANELSDSSQYIINL